MIRIYSREIAKRKLFAGLIFVLVSFMIFFPFIIPVVLGVFLVRWFLKKKNNVTTYRTNKMNLHDLPYEKKASQITEAEMNFYKVLEEVVAGRFDIQRQVLLSTLVTTTSRFFTDSSTGRKYNPDRSKIDRLTIDFVLFNKVDLSPYLAIELDDKSHLQEDRVARDEFVNEVLLETGIRLVRVKNAYSYNVSEIAELVK